MLEHHSQVVHARQRRAFPKIAHPVKAVEGRCPSNGFTLWVRERKSFATLVAIAIDAVAAKEIPGEDSFLDQTFLHVSQSQALRHKREYPACLEHLLGRGHNVAICRLVAEGGLGTQYV